MLAFKLNMIFTAMILLFALYEALYILFASKAGIFMKLVAFLIVVIVVYVGIKRNTYLPFLGAAVMPGSIFPESLVPKDADLTFSVPIQEADNTKLVYWASKTSDKNIEDPFTAYGDFSNIGVTKVKNNKAEMKVNCPASYYIPGGKLLSPHIHYRVIYPKGMVGQVETVYVDCHAKKP